MGFWNIFKTGPSKEAILGQVRKAKEVYAQSEYRRMAMEKLLKWNTTDSLGGLLERFCVVVQSPHWDEDEKRWLVEELIKIGDKIKPILHDFILKKNEVNHALVAYRKVSANDEDYKELLVEALKSRPPRDHRSVQGKQELIAALSELDHGSFDDLLLPYLEDHSDDVQCAAIDVLSQSDDKLVKDSLAKLLESEVHSARVLRAAANVVAQKKIPLTNDIRLSDVVREDFMIEEGHLVRLLHKERAE
jgi:hypothetical protein